MSNVLKCIDYFENSSCGSYCDCFFSFICQIVISDCVRQVLQKTNTKPSDIDVLIINCSLFSPTPSLCAMVINEFNMRSDILSYNLSGMVTTLHLLVSPLLNTHLTINSQGCSAGVISVDLAKNILAGRPHSLALVVSTENLTQALYLGNDRAFLLQNTLFRCGAWLQSQFLYVIMLVGAY